MRRSTPVLLALCLLLACGEEGAFPPVESPPLPDEPALRAQDVTAPVRLNAYFAEWGIYDRDYPVESIPASSLDAVTYAFADISPEGEVAIFDAYAAGINFPKLRALKGQHPHLKVMLAVGGYTLSHRFPAVAASPESRRKFAVSAVHFCREQGFDGIDIDWEYPANPTERTDFTLLMAELDSQLGANGLLLSAALPATPGFINVQAVARRLDWINLMTYDYHGSWEPDRSGHNAPLFAGDQRAVHDTVRRYLNSGVPAGKILLGIPAYGRSWAGATGPGSSASGPGPGTWEPGMLDYRNILARMSARPQTYPRFWDAEARVPYLLTPSGVFVTYEDNQSLGGKLNYARNQGLAGVMFWELSADARDPARSLVEQAARALR